MHPYVLGFSDLDMTKLALAGGKGANLGELSRIPGIRVPEGFCISTEAFGSTIARSPSIAALLDRLASSTADDRDAIRALSAEIRRAIEAAPIPDDLASAITHRLTALGATTPYAVRSSATAEDLPTASFAGQHDTYLNVVGAPAVLAHVRKCWASLYTERAVAYRVQQGIDHRQVRLAVIVQRMVFPQAAGVLFTADPVTSNRMVASIDASFGLGEALVAGLVDPDGFEVRDGAIRERRIATKKRATVALPEGGTAEQDLAPDRQRQPALTDAQAIALAALGRTIEAHFGCPQDIEWCLADDAFHVVQSRPITTLFPIPEANDGQKHVYVSVGHQQMMTDPFKPLGRSMWQLSAGRPMYVAGGRFFVDVARELASATGRDLLLNALVGKSDPLIKDALATLIARGFIALAPDAGEGEPYAPPAWLRTQVETDPAIVPGLIARHQAYMADLERDIQAQSGPALFDFIREDNQKAKQLSDIAVIMAAVNAASWLNEHVEAWLGEKNVADTLAQSVDHNVTSAMGLALLDVADAVRPHPEVVEALAHEDFLDRLAALDHGHEARAAILGYLETYGMRCVGEIDVTRPRWREQPATLVPLILSNVKNFGPGAGGRRFEQGRQEAAKKAQELLARLKALPDGERKAAEAKHMIDRLRMFAGYREYPKYGMISRYFVYKQALMTEAERLVEAGVLHEPEDAHYLTFEELQDVVRTHALDARLVADRKAEFARHAKLVPPRVLTSEGEVVVGRYQREGLPAGALVGLAVSSGVVEGRARVLFDLADAELEAGDILVTPFTDPSWTPLFVAIEGLVTEVGGLMTHGAVVAREYGLPAVVGVGDATRLIEDGRRIRVHGTEGYVELL